MGEKLKGDLAFGAVFGEISLTDVASDLVSGGIEEHAVVPLNFFS